MSLFIYQYIQPYSQNKIHKHQALNILVKHQVFYWKKGTLLIPLILKYQSNQLMMGHHKKDN